MFCCVILLSIFTHCLYFDSSFGLVKIQHDLQKYSVILNMTKRLTRFMYFILSRSILISWTQLHSQKLSETKRRISFSVSVLSLSQHFDKSILQSYRLALLVVQLIAQAGFCLLLFIIMNFVLGAGASLLLLAPSLQNASTACTWG